MNKKTKDLMNSKNPKEFTRDNSGNDPFANTERDEGTLGVRHDRKVNPALADEDQPTWQPPESIPEPRPADPIMKPTQQSNPSTNTNSPA